MLVTKLALDGLLLITPDVFSDSRGFFLESYNRPHYTTYGIDVEFVQDNHSRSSFRVLRGLHYQASPGQAKLVSVILGSIFVVSVVIRKESSTFGQWVGVQLDEQNHKQLFIPVGFAHGFYVMSYVCDVMYKCSSPYNGEQEKTIAWNDPDINIVWPYKDPIISNRDKCGKLLREI
jgi:dTDP-4-dehydrorhamnose 3,5-epimerase